MNPPPRSASDAAADVLRQAIQRRRAARDTRLGWFMAWDRLDLFGRLPWHQRPLTRPSPAPRFLPIGRFDQAVFAEAFRQALVEGFAVPRAIELAAGVNPCRCFRRALLLTHARVCAGEPLGPSLGRSGAWIGRALPEALGAGEEFGCLTDALAAFVRQVRTFSGPRFLRAIGRRPETGRFADALAILLRDHPLTGTVVRAAGQMTGGGRRFDATVLAIADAMSEGVPFTEALRRSPRDFDPLFLEFLGHTESRAEMRACLERLARAGDPG